MTFSEIQEDDRPDFTKEREELNELLRISKENEARLSENNRQLLEKYEQLMEKYRKIESEYQHLNKKYDEIGKKLENSQKEAFESKVPVDNSVRIEKPQKQPDFSNNFNANAFDDNSNKSVLISRRRPEEINIDNKIKEFSTSFEGSSGKSDKIKKMQDDLKSLEESSIKSRKIEKSSKIQEEDNSVVFSKKPEKIVKENNIQNMGVSMVDSRKIEKRERKNMEPPSFKNESQLEEMVFSTKIEKKTGKNETETNNGKTIDEEIVFPSKIEKKTENNSTVFSRKSSARFTSPKNAEVIMAFSRKIEKIPSKNDEYSGKHQEISTQTPLNTENPLDESLNMKDKNEGKEMNYRRSSTENLDKLLNSMILYKARVLTIHQSHQKNRHMSQISQNISQNMSRTLLKEGLG